MRTSSWSPKRARHMLTRNTSESATHTWGKCMAKPRAKPPIPQNGSPTAKLSGMRPSGASESDAARTAFASSEAEETELMLTFFKRDRSDAGSSAVATVSYAEMLRSC